MTLMKLRLDFLFADLSQHFIQIFHYGHGRKVICVAKLKVIHTTTTQI